MMKLTAVMLCAIPATQARWWKNSNYMKRMKDRAAGEISVDLLEKLRSTKYILDTRSAEEREEADISMVDLGDAQVITIEYNNFWDKEKFFGSFKADSEFYDKANDGQDVDIFPEDVDLAEMGADFTLICGTRSCGCRWNLLWDHGFRGHAWYVDDVNDWIESNSILGMDEDMGTSGAMPDFDSILTK